MELEQKFWLVKSKKVWKFFPHLKFFQCPNCRFFDKYRFQMREFSFSNAKEFKSY